MIDILIVGPIPPPYHGVSMATDLILNSELRYKFKLVHLDISDRRSLLNIGRLDFKNILLAIVHILRLSLLLITRHPKIVYIPICQTISGYLRDLSFMILSKLFGARIIIHLHGGYFRELCEKSNFIFKFIIKLSLKFISKAIVLGDCLKYIFEGFVPASKIVVVRNGINDHYKEYFSRNNPGLNKPIKIIYLSSLSKEKGYLDVIQAIPEVIKKYKNVKFIFAGEYWKKEDEIFAKNYISNNKLSSFIDHIGVVAGKEKFDLLLSSDIFVFPSYNEGQPFAIIEAMSAGLPIITTDTGAIKEMVIDGENGFIVEKQNPAQIAQKIIYLIENPDERMRMGQKSRERFLKYYTKDQFINGLAKVFEEVLANP